jgi:hypothetical protein
MNGLIEEHQLLPKCNDNNGTPNTDPLIRRHTTPDMAASAAYGMGTLRRNFLNYQ